MLLARNEPIKKWFNQVNKNKVTQLCCIACSIFFCVCLIWRQHIDQYEYPVDFSTYLWATAITDSSVLKSRLTKDYSFDTQDLFEEGFLFVRDSNGNIPNWHINVDNDQVSITCVPSGYALAKQPIRMHVNDLSVLASNLTLARYFGYQITNELIYNCLTNEKTYFEDTFFDNISVSVTHERRPSVDSQGRFRFSWEYLLLEKDDGQQLGCDLISILREYRQSSQH